MGSICLLSDGALPSVSCVTHYRSRSFVPMFTLSGAGEAWRPAPGPWSGSGEVCMHAKLISLNGTCRRVVLLMLLPVMARQGDAPCARPCGRENTCADFNRSFTCDRLSSGLGCNCTGCCLAILMPSPRLAPPAALNTTPLIRAAQTSANNNQTAVHVSSVAALAVQECALVRSQKSFSLNNRQTRTGCAPGRRLEGQTANGRLELADINSVEYLPVCYRYFDCFDSFSGWYGMVVFTSGIDSLIFVRHLIV